MWKFGLILLIAFIHTSSQCNINEYVLHEHHDYKNAVRICAMGEKKFNQLFTPRNWVEMTFLARYTANFGEAFWTGVHNFIQLGDFVTLHGESFVENDYFSWAPGHPLVRPQFECGSIQTNGQLKTELCRNVRHFLCKRVTFGRKWIQFRSNSSFYNDAIIDCALEGGQLMSPHTQVEFNELYARAVHNNESQWLGVNDIQNEGIFINHDGVSVFPRDFLVWAPGRPQYDTNRNCVELRPDGFISDVSCFKMLKYHCNK